MLQVTRPPAVTGATRTPVALSKVRWWAQNWAQCLRCEGAELSAKRTGVNEDAPGVILLFLFFSLRLIAD